MKSLLIAVLFALSAGANYYQWRVMVEDTARIAALVEISNRAIQIASQRAAEAAQCRRNRTMEASL